MRSRMIALVCVLCWLVPARAQTYQPFNNPHQQFLDTNGKPLANGKIYTYAAGTTTKAATYTSSTGTTSNSNPVILDGAGFATVYLDIAKSYKIVLQNAQGVQQWVADNVTGGVPTGGGAGMIYPAAGAANSTGIAWGPSYGASNPFPVAFIPILNQNTTGTAGGLSANITESQVTNLTSDLAAKAPKASPIFTGTITTPITGGGTQCAQLSNTGVLSGTGSACGGGGIPWPGAAGIANYNGSSAWGTSYSSSNLIPANFISVLNQNTTGTAAGLSANITESQVTNLVTDLAAKQSSLGFTPENVANKGVASGYAGLDASSHTLAANQPAFTGDATSPAGSLVTTVAGIQGVAVSGVQGAASQKVQLASGSAPTTGHFPSYAADGSLVDSTQPSGSSAPIFSTPQLGVSMLGATGNIGSAVAMTTPGSDGTYLITGQLTQTTPGSTGTCTTGVMSVYLYFQDADTGVNYTGSSYLSFQAVSGANQVLSQLTMTSAANGATNSFIMVPHYFRAKGGTAIKYQLSQATLSNCTIPPVFNVRFALFGPLGY